jgi:hypothetical protein
MRQGRIEKLNKEIADKLESVMFGFRNDYLIAIKDCYDDGVINEPESIEPMFVAHRRKWYDFCNDFKKRTHFGKTGLSPDIDAFEKKSQEMLDGYKGYVFLEAMKKQIEHYGLDVRPVDFIDKVGMKANDVCIRYIFDNEVTEASVSNAETPEHPIVKEMVANL